MPEMKDPIAQLSQLDPRARSVKPPESVPTYDFETLGDGLAAAIMDVAETQLAEAQSQYDQAKLLAATIRSQVFEEAKVLAIMNRRLRAMGETMLDVHRKLNGNDGSINGNSE